MTHLLAFASQAAKIGQGLKRQVIMDARLPLRMISTVVEIKEVELMRIRGSHPLGSGSRSVCISGVGTS